MIARERKLAQEAARLSSSTSAATEKTPCDRPPQTEATTSKPARLTTPLVSIPSAPSAPSANTSSPAPFPAPIEKRFTCPSDSKIADEIRELQEREEELRELRERLHVQVGRPQVSLFTSEGCRYINKRQARTCTINAEGWESWWRAKEVPTDWMNKMFNKQQMLLLGHPPNGGDPQYGIP